MGIANCIKRDELEALGYHKSMFPEFHSYVEGIWFLQENLSGTQGSPLLFAEDRPQQKYPESSGNLNVSNPA